MLYGLDASDQMSGGARRLNCTGAGWVPARADINYCWVGRRNNIIYYVIQERQWVVDCVSI